MWKPLLLSDNTDVFPLWMGNSLCIKIFHTARLPHSWLVSKTMLWMLYCQDNVYSAAVKHHHNSIVYYWVQ